MKVERTTEAAHRLSTRLTAISVLLAISVFTNAILVMVAFTVRQTVLVPMLPGSVTLSGTGGVSGDYLEAFARDTAYLFLNRSPDNESYFDQQLLQIADGSTYQVVRDALIDADRRNSAAHISQSFIPVDWYLDPKKLYAEVSGNLITGNGAQQNQSSAKLYAMRFVRRGAGLRLLSFEEISNKQSLGAKLPITPPPLPRGMPISTEVQP